jgi:hypothetical protein
MALRRPLGSIVFAAVVASTIGCSGRSAASSVAGHPSNAPGPMCAAFSGIQAGEASMRRLFPPLPHGEAAAIESGRAAAVAALVATATPELAPVVDRFAAEDDAQGQLLLAEWGTDGTALLAQVDANDFGSLSGWVDRNGLRLADGSAFTAADYSRDTDLAFDDLTQACDVPPAGWHELHDSPSFRAPAGTIAFVSASRTLIRGTVGADGAITGQAIIHTGGQLGNVAFAPDGRHLTFQDGRTVWIASPDGSGAHPLTPAGEYWACASWSPGLKRTAR